MAWLIDCSGWLIEWIRWLVHWLNWWIDWLVGLIGLIDWVFDCYARLDGRLVARLVWLSGWFIWYVDWLIASVLACLVDGLIWFGRVFEWLVRLIGLLIDCLSGFWLIRWFGWFVYLSFCWLIDRLIVVLIVGWFGRFVTWLIWLVVLLLMVLIQLIDWLIGCSIELIGWLIGWVDRFECLL